MSLSILLASCGAQSSQSQPLPVEPLNCAAMPAASEDALYENALTILQDDLCQPMSTGPGVDHKAVMPLDSAAQPSQRLAQNSLGSLAVEPREYALPTVLKQGQPTSPLERTAFNPEYLSPEQDELLDALIADILADYGNPQTEVGKLRALRDWVARTIIHPYSYFHLFKPYDNTANLPEGKNWKDFATYATNTKVYEDFRFLWGTYKLDGFKLLDHAIDLTGGNAGGLMQKVEGSHYRVRDLANNNFYQCTPQAMILIALSHAMGYQGVLISTAGHDTAAIYIPSLSKWIYMDPTYNEDYVDRVTGALLSPDELLEKSFEGTVFQDAVAVKSPGPKWDPDVYLDFTDSPTTTYFNEHREGMQVMGSQLNADMIDNTLYNTRQVQVMTPKLPGWSPFDNERQYVRVLPQRAFPELGLYAGQMKAAEKSGYDVTVLANVPVQDLEMKLGEGDWQPVTGWTPGGTVNIDFPGGLVYLRATEKAGLKTSTMIVQMPEALTPPVTPPTTTDPAPTTPTDPAPTTPTDPAPAPTTDPAPTSPTPTTTEPAPAPTTTTP